MNIQYLLEAHEMVKAAKEKVIDLAIDELETDKRTRWLYERFFQSRFLDTLYETATIIPSSRNISAEALLAVEEGLQTHLLTPLGVNIITHIESYSSTIDHLFRDATQDGIVHDFEPKENIRSLIPNTYCIVVHNAEYIYNVPERVAGLAENGGTTTTILERAYTKGRLRDGEFIRMSEEERIEYMQHLSGHENLHTIGDQPDLQPNTHEMRGLQDEKNCLGYSEFSVPGALCEGCIESIQARWYGREIRDGKQYFREKLPHRIPTLAFRRHPDTNEFTKQHPSKRVKIEVKIKPEST